MKKSIALFALLATVLGQLSAREVKISVGAGESWKDGHIPQFAVWLEDTEGNYLKTLYITKKASRKSWIFCPQEGRPESLPVWYHASKHETAKIKAKNKSDNDLQIDAVTSATPKGGITFTASITDEPCVVKAEFNKSFDYNEFYTKANSTDNGQPSLIYAAVVQNGETQELKLEFAGTGSIDGSDGEIHTNTENLTTAKNIVKIATLTFSEEKTKTE